MEGKDGGRNGNVGDDVGDGVVNGGDEVAAVGVAGEGAAYLQTAGSGECVAHVVAVWGVRVGD